MRVWVAGIGAGVVAALGGGAAAVATSGTPTTQQPPVEQAAAVEVRTASFVGPQQRLLDVAGERKHVREKPARKPRPVRLKKPPKKADPKKAQALAAQAERGADTPKAHLVRAYRKAPSFAPAGCGIEPELLAAIGQVESGNIGGRSLTDHVVTPGVYGPPLTGGAFARIADSDGGRLDGSSAYDRAVGPMQFIPTTWAMWGTDADGDGRADPQNVYDAAASAARYLCAGGRNLGAPGSLRAAILSYNYSGEYVATVLSWKGFFERNGLGAIGDTSRFVPNGVVTATTKSRDEHAADPVPRPGPKDTVPSRPSGSSTASRPPTSSSSTSARPKPTGPTSSTPPSPEPTTPSTTTEPAEEPPPTPSPTPTEPAPTPTETSPSPSPEPSASPSDDRAASATAEAPAAP